MILFKLYSVHIAAVLRDVSLLYILMMNVLIIFFVLLLQVKSMFIMPDRNVAVYGRTNKLLKS